MSSSRRKGRRILGELDANAETPVRKVEKKTVDEERFVEVTLLGGPMGIEFEAADEEGEIGCRVVRMHDVESEMQARARSGVAPGDLVVKIDDEGVANWTFGRIVDALRLRKDRQKCLTFHRRRGPLDDVIQTVSKLRQSARKERRRGGDSRTAVSESALSSTRAALRSIKKAMTSCESESDGFWSAASSPVVVKKDLFLERDGRRRGDLVREALSLRKDTSHARVVAETTRESEALKSESEHTRAVLGRVANVLESSSDAASAEIENKVRRATRELRAALEASEKAREMLKADAEAREAEREAAERQRQVESRASEKEIVDKMREDAAARLREALSNRDAAHRAEVVAMREELESDAARRAAAELRAESARARLRHEDELRDAEARFGRKLRRALQDQREEILLEERRDRTAARDEIQIAERRLLEARQDLATARQSENAAVDELRASEAAAHALARLYEDASADLLLDDEDYERRLTEAEVRHSQVAQELERYHGLVADFEREREEFRNQIEDFRRCVESRDEAIDEMREKAARLDQSLQEARRVASAEVEEARRRAEEEVEKVRELCEARVAQIREEASSHAQQEKKLRDDEILKKASSDANEAEKALSAQVKFLEKLVRERDEWIQNDHPRQVEAARREGERRANTESKLAFRGEVELRDARHAAEIARLEKEVEAAKNAAARSEEEAAIDECLSSSSAGEEGRGGGRREELEMVIAVRDARIAELDKLLAAKESSFVARDKNLRGLVTKYADETGQLRRRLDAANLAASQVREQLAAARASSKDARRSLDELSYSTEEDVEPIKIDELKRRDAQLAALALSLDAVNAEMERARRERDRAKFTAVASSAAAKAALRKSDASHRVKKCAHPKRQQRRRPVAGSDAVAAVAMRLQSSVRNTQFSFRPSLRNLRRQSCGRGWTRRRESRRRKCWRPATRRRDKTR